MDWCDGIEEPRLLIAPVHCTLTTREDANATASAEGSILSLRHPNSGRPTCYILLNGILHELNWFKQSYGSWFLADYVREDGSLYLTTKVDPIFVLLPLFEDARMKKGNDQGMFRQLEEILYIDGYPGYQHLASLAESSMQLVCEVKEIGSTKFYRLDDAKVLAWLNHKVHNLKDALTKLDNNYAIQEEKDTLKDAISILGEYMKEEPWLTQLCSHLQLETQESCTTGAQKLSDSVFLDSTLVSSSLQGNTSNGKQQRTSNSGKQAKKIKIETDSKNIKDMFRRATRKGS